MNAQTSPVPASLRRAEAEDGDLDARILQAEQRLIAREENLHRRWAAARQRVQRRWKPGRLLLPLSISVGLGVLGWLRRGRRTAPAAPAASSTPNPPLQAAASGPGGLPWLQLVGMVWPLLPATWRQRVSPATLNMLLNVGLPLAENLLRPRHPPLATAGPLAATQLAGDWFEVAGLPQRAAAGGGPAPRWQHTLRDDGGIDLHACRLQPDGSASETLARAVAVAGSAGARWRISDWPAPLQTLPLAWHEMAVLHLDATAGTLLLGSPGRDRLRLLSRTPGLEPQRLQPLLAVAREEGFDIQRLQYAEADAMADG